MIGTIEENREPRSLDGKIEELYVIARKSQETSVRFYVDLCSSKISEPPTSSKDWRSTLTRHYTKDMPAISKYETKTVEKSRQLDDMK